MIRAALLLTVAGLTACAGNRPVPTANFAATSLPPVAAQFRTVQTLKLAGELREQTTQWRFWRDAQQIASENLDESTGELWQRDGATVFHRTLHHEDRRGIESQISARSEEDWVQQALIVSPALLAQLPEKQTGWRHGYPFRRYAGKIGDADWNIVLRVDQMLPVSIERKEGPLTVRTEALSTHALATAPWQPRDASEYEIIDAADLGDREQDPFVQKVERQMGGIHRH